MPRVPDKPHLELISTAAATLRSFNFDWLMHSLTYLVSRAEVKLTRQYLNQMTHHQLSYGGFCVLMLASANPGIDQVQAAAMLDLDKANTAALIRDLVNTGWLARRRVLHDRRCQGVFLTPDGVTRLAALKREMREFELRFCGSLSESERAAAVYLLRRICFDEPIDSPQDDASADTHT